MKYRRISALTEKFLKDVTDESVRARTLLPGNRHRMGALHEKVDEVVRAMLKLECVTNRNHHTLSLDEEVYVECVRAAVMVLRVATEGDSNYQYQNPYYRSMDEEDYAVQLPLPMPDPEVMLLDINEVQEQVPCRHDVRGVGLVHPPTGCTIYCDKHATLFENKAAALKELSQLVSAHLSWE